MVLMGLIVICTIEGLGLIGICTIEGLGLNPAGVCGCD
jgi:hypothetical protein